MSKESKAALYPALQGLLQTTEASTPTWEEIADQLAQAFASVRANLGAAMFPAIKGMVWYDAIVAYENKKWPMLAIDRADPSFVASAITRTYPGRNGG